MLKPVKQLLIMIVFFFFHLSAFANNVHIVEYGDTPLAIARRYNLNIRTLALANNVKDYNSWILNVGDGVNIPKVHIVQKGETLYRIALNYGITVDDLRDFNQLGKRTIFSDQTLIISPPQNLQQGLDRHVTKFEQDNVATSSTSLSDSLYHTVQKGETLYRIAQNYNLSVDSLKKINKISSDIVFIGQKILVQPFTDEELNKKDQAFLSQLRKNQTKEAQIKPLSSSSLNNKNVKPLFTQDNQDPHLSSSSNIPFLLEKNQTRSSDSEDSFLYKKYKFSYWPVSGARKTIPDTKGYGLTFATQGLENVHSSSSGRVVYVARRDRAYIVLVEFDSIVFCYLGLDEVSVYVGETVYAGKQIGITGQNTSEDNKGELHFLIFDEESDFRFQDLTF